MLRKKKARKKDPRGYGITISAYVSPGLYKRLVRAASTDRRSTSNVVEMLIEQGLPAYEAKLIDLAKK